MPTRSDGTEPPDAWDNVVTNSWTPARKGVVGRAAGSPSDIGGKQAEKNADNVWEFDDEFREEKRQEMEKQLTARVFEEKKKPELTELFNAEASAADVLGNFDDRYLLQMIVDKRQNVPLDPDELALFRKLYTERYGAPKSPILPAGEKQEETPLFI